jgi:DNA-binding transcriptional ArsR family regulator
MSEDIEKKQRADAGSAEVDMATAVGNPWRFRILEAASLGDVSPSGFIRAYGGEISNISRHFRQLAKWGYLEQVERKSGGPRRGGVERFYRSVRRAHIDTPSSSGLSQMLREEISDTILTAYLTEVREALDAGTFDVDVDRHLSWMALELNRECFRELSGWLDDILARLPALQEKARTQMERSGEKAIAATVGLASFRVPPHSPGARSRSSSTSKD